jgi:CHAT domain-containing protein
MNRQNLAKKLVSAKSEKERKTLLQNNVKIADENLALELKEICYAAWTNEPTKAQKTARAIKSLYKFNTNNEIKAYSFWISGIAELTRGKLEFTIKNLDDSAKIFKQIGNEHEAANTQVAKLYALALIGKYDEAIKCGENALKIFEKYGDELAAGKIEMNLSNIVSRREFHKQAEKYCLSARDRFAKIDEKDWLTMAENSLANTYAELNDFVKAEKFYETALKGAKESKMFVTEAEIEASMGNLATFRGKFDRALNFLESSRQKYENLKMPHQTAIAELEIADIYLELNLSEEAFSIYEKTTEKLQKLKMQGEEARARANFGKAAILLDEKNKARNELKKSARLFLAEKNKVGAAAVKLNEAKLELNLGNFQKVLNLVAESEKLLEKSENLRHKLTAKWLKGEALRNVGKFKESEISLSQTFKDALKQEQQNIAQITLNSLGNLALQKGDQDQAKKYFEKAIGLIEKLRAPLPAEEFRMAFLANKLAPFENLAKIHLAENDLEKAFFYIEKARSRSLLESLDKDFHLEDRTKNSSKLFEKLTNWREELNWFYSRLDRAEDAEIKSLQENIRMREKQVSDVMRQIESTKRAKFSKAKLSEKNSLKDLQKQIGKQKVLIEFIKLDGNLSAFIISEGGIDYIENLAKESEILELLEGLQFQFGALRFGTKHLEKFMPELKKRADFYLEKLFEKLIKPIQRFLEKQNLVIIPVGALHYVPFHALFDGVSYLIESREVVYSPSATVWQKLNRKKSEKLKNALLFGFADEKIPLVNDEIEALKKIFDTSESFIGKEANFTNYTKNAPDFDILHLACHGQFRPENPLFSSLHLADGFVTVRDICSQKLIAELVVLSACETGLNKIFAGDEILGLARGFLTAGAGSLILSLWTVNDEATTELMKDFYAELQRGKTISASLRKVQQKFIEKGKHPYFWSPFVIIGK